MLGAHCEGPFINRNRNGIHPENVLLEPINGIDSLAECYGSENITSGAIKLVTIAPELPGALSAITALKKHSIISAIGHTTTTHEIAIDSMAAGASTITHLFNAMEPLHHRNPGVFGLLGGAGTEKPFFGIIADGIHLHPTCVNIAWHAHPEGLILVTDAMFATGLPDGIYDWTNGEKIEKCGQVLKLHGSDGKIAGSATMMVECVNNFMTWTGATEAEALNAATRTPARMLGLEKEKGSLDAGSDADLVILDLVEGEDGSKSFTVEQVWKFGRLVHTSSVQTTK
jgi:N-acetylglucosamine-6-phosphate deacetylase